MISIKQLSVQVKGRTLLKNINLNIELGKPLSIIGESGAGKSTLAQALLGHHVGTLSGEINIDGNNILNYNDKQKRSYRRNHIALVPQSTAESLNPQLKVVQHLLETCRCANKITKKQALARVEQQLNLCQVPKVLWSRYPKGLSGGEVQRVLLANALINNPKILVLDEPDAALDSHLRDQLRQQIIALSKQKYILWISHNLEHTQQLIGNIAVLKQGELVEYNCMKTLFQHPQKAYTQQLITNDLSLLKNKTALKPDAEMVIQAKNLSKTYHRQTLFSNLDLSLKKGEIVALFGASGIGKSTLARQLCGFSSPDTGSIRLAPNISTAWVSQHPIRSLPPFFTLFDAIAEPLFLQKNNKKDIKQAVFDILPQVKLSPDSKRLKQRIHRFSGGELQRIALARALITQPQIIIADEITASLDRATRHDIMQLLLEKQQQGLSMLFITHDEALGRHIAHRCLWIYNKRLFVIS